MFTVDQVICHVIGDYVFQSDWMAKRKAASWWVALVHAVCYTLPFLYLTRDTGALAVICFSHAIIDYYRLARYVIWAKNQLGPKAFRYPWAVCDKTGYHDSEAPWMAVWLMIIVDNTMHILINGLALSHFSVRPTLPLF